MSKTPTCLHCNGPLPEPAATGRPRKFCSTPCRRAGDAEVRRVDRRLAELERDASHLRMHGASSILAALDGPEVALANVDDEIAYQKRRLALLLSEE